MLQLPDDSQPLKVMGIDPGTKKLGVSLLSWPVGHPRYIVDEAFTIVASEQDSAYQAYADLHGSLAARIKQLEIQFGNALQWYRPHVVIAETPFMGKFPHSYAALTELYAALRRGVWKYDPTLTFFGVDPPTAKRDAGVILKRRKRGDKQNKDDVRTALIHNIHLQWQVDINTLDEHAVDATAVAYHFMSQLV